jgi:hypothetical protein
MSLIALIAYGLIAFAIFGVYRSLDRFITGHVMIIVAKGVLVTKVTKN